MVSTPFHPDDINNAVAKPDAFTPGNPGTPNIYALQHHLALEVVAFLQDRGVPFQFRGGTALHTKLPERRRFSIDVDITTDDQDNVYQALKKFGERFPKSSVKLREPPGALKVQGVRYVLDFEHVPADRLRILVEVVEGKLEVLASEPLRIRGDGFDWGVDVQAPTFEAFTAQKLAVLGPNTIGKPVGLHNVPEAARSNQGVCKQIFDLRELLRQPLNGDAVRTAYEVAVDEGNTLRGTSHAVENCLTDAIQLVGALKAPRSWDQTDPIRFGLWSGYRDSTRWIPNANRTEWADRHYRIAGGAIARLGEAVRQKDPDLDSVGRPVQASAPPAEIMEAITKAQQDAAPWFKPEFGADAMIAWAWAPRELW